MQNRYHPAVKRILRWLKIIIPVYIVIGIILYFLQEKILFHPKKLAQDYAYNFQVPFKEINLAISNERNLSIVQFTVPDSMPKGVVLYFHGNRENINRYAPFAGNFTKQGYEVMMMDYPGFGKSTGKRSEQIIYDDALQLYKLARSRFSPDSIILYGKSLGSGVASQLASIRDCKRLILETPYYSLATVAKRYFFIYPVKPFAKYAFPTYKYFEKITAPITILHGTSDGVIPYEEAKKLEALKKSGMELVTIKNGSHNDLNNFPLFRWKLDSLLKL